MLWKSILRTYFLDLSIEALFQKFAFVFASTGRYHGPIYQGQKFSSIRICHTSRRVAKEVYDCTIEHVLPMGEYEMVLFKWEGPEPGGFTYSRRHLEFYT